MDSERTSVDVASRIVAHYQLVPSTTADGVMVVINGKRDVTVLMQRGKYLILMSYRFEEDQRLVQQNPGNWTEEGIAGLAEQTGERLEDAISVSERGDEALGIGNVVFSGDPALDTIPPWVYTQLEYYRVLNGDVVPFEGEIEAPAVADIAPGITDLYISHLVPGNEDAKVPGNEDATIDIRITLATFESARLAAEFAESPTDLVPLYWLPDVSYDSPILAGDGVTYARGATEYAEHIRDIEGQVGSGYRAVQRFDRHVVVVEMISIGQAEVTESSVAWLMDAQAACITALPEPCAAVPVDNLAAALEQNATPEAMTNEGAVVGEGFGRAVTVPDDEADMAGSDFVELWSDRRFARFETVIGHGDDPPQCVFAELDALQQFEERAVIKLVSDGGSEPDVGKQTGHAWAIYTVEPLEDVRSDQEYTIRFDCYTLVFGDASLAMTQIAPLDLWKAERDKGQRLRHGITLADTRQFGEAPLVAERTEIGRTFPVINRRFWIDLAA